MPVSPWSIHTTLDLAYGVLADQRLDFYRQVERVGEPDHTRPLVDARPLLVWFHGGGWLFGDRRAQIHHIGPFLAAGWHVASVGYRLGPGTAPAAADDAREAVRWICGQGRALGFDHSATIVGGASAGGHLALYAAISESKTAVDGVINFYGITDLELLDRHFGDRLEDNYLRVWARGRDFGHLLSSYSPVALAGANSPAVITVHGDADSVVPLNQATVLHDRLTDLGVRNQLLVLEGGNHGGFTAEQLEHASAAVFDFFNHQAR